MLCLICMPKARGLKAYISGKARVPMLLLICYTSGTLKICLTLDYISSLYLYNWGCTLWLWDFIMMLALCFVHYERFQLKPTINIFDKEWTLTFKLWCPIKDFTILDQSVVHTWCPPRSCVTFEYKPICIKLLHWNHWNEVYMVMYTSNFLWSEVWKCYITIYIIQHGSAV